MRQIFIFIGIVWGLFYNIVSLQGLMYKGQGPIRQERTPKKTYNCQNFNYFINILLRIYNK